MDVLAKLAKYNLQIAIEKCQFLMNEIDECSLPEKPTTLCRHLGMIIFIYSHLIPTFPILFSLMMLTNPLKKIKPSWIPMLVQII